MDSILNKLTEIESAAVSIVQHAEAEKSILDIVSGSNRLR